MLLARPFDYTDYVRPACLPPRNFNLGSSTGRMIISGLGNTAQTGQRDKFPDTMQYTTIPMCSQSTCKSNANIGPYFKEGIVQIADLITQSTSLQNFSFRHYDMWWRSRR